MIKKLVISAVVLAALISAKESHAAGVAGFARGLSSMMTAQIHTSDVPTAKPHDAANEGVLTLDFTKRRELMNVNANVNGTMAELDGYLDSMAGGFSLAQANGCTDCADLKRDQLISLGWSDKAMRVAYAVNGEGVVERVLVINTDRGDVVLGSAIEMPAERLPAAAQKSAAPAKPAFLDL
ncbi:transglutaminase-like cysteine peptidase [Rhizobium sp. XQZ8]|uniref:transglutaminase-like cysteine peptidase n=1 Tax=Rhizobium populisoli TaxID=2859785 RepID=UPI001CA5604C|nr:transglutaminase-like cysteine peptidase [Rhizobium populisoli]MBW6421422.1 transglutaminase-like cysteine peptidase [Rhizobium populisoli]